MAKRRAARRRTYGARTRRGGRHKKSIAILPLATAVLPSAITFGSDMAEGFTMKQSANDTILKLTGFNIGEPGQKWDAGNATNGMILLGGIGLSIAGRKLGLNKYVPLPKGFKLF